MKKQVLVIHGGTTFDTYDEYLAYLRGKETSLPRLLAKDWKANLQDVLGAEYLVVAPRMPNGDNAKYAEWKVWFEKVLPLLDHGVILIGHSLGALFLAKYLAENEGPRKIRATFLVAAPSAAHPPESLADFALPGDLSRLASQGGDITLYQSEDDPVVPASDLDTYRAALPSARVRIFTDRQHFNQSAFPELVDDIRALGGEA